MEVIKYILLGFKCCKINVPKPLRSHIIYEAYPLLICKDVVKPDSRLHIVDWIKGAYIYKNEKLLDTSIGILVITGTKKDIKNAVEKLYYFSNSLVSRYIYDGTLPLKICKRSKISSEWPSCIETIAEIKLYYLFSTNDKTDLLETLSYNVRYSRIAKLFRHTSLAQFFNYVNRDADKLYYILNEYCNTISRIIYFVNYARNNLDLITWINCGEDMEYYEVLRDPRYYMDAHKALLSTVRKKTLYSTLTKL
jgi:hypothetical protein